MKDAIRYPEHFAPVAQDEMVYLTGGGIVDSVGNAVDSVVDTTASVINEKTVFCAWKPAREM